MQRECQSLAPQVLLRGSTWNLSLGPSHYPVTLTACSRMVALVFSAQLHVLTGGRRQSYA
jgi:hypothetical protein